MALDDAFPIRVYFRDEQERQIVEDLLRPTSGDDLAVYGASIEGRVTRNVFTQLLDQGLVVSAVAPGIGPSPESPSRVADAAEPGAPRASGVVTIPRVVSDLAWAGIRIGVALATKYFRRNPRAARALEEALASRGLSRSDVMALLTNLEGDAAAFLRQQAAPIQPSATDVYEVAVRVPLRPEWRRELDQIGGGVIGYEPPNVFHVVVTTDEVARLRGLRFVTNVSRYGLDKALATSLLGVLDVLRRQPAARRDPTGAVRRQTFEIVLHRDTDRERAKTMLARFGCALSAESKSVLRFEAPLDAVRLAALADQPEVKLLALYRPARLFCDQARKFAGVDRVCTPTAPPTSTWDGADELIGVFDSGIDESHPDFQGRIAAQLSYGTGPAKGTTNDLIGHGTHVAGIIAGSGAASQGVVKGMAPAAKLISVGIVAPANGGRPDILAPPDIGDLLVEATQRGAKIINISWGTALAGEYTRGAAQLDAFLYEHSDVLVVIAAGNEGEARQGVHRLRTLGSPAASKNALTVAACGSGRTGIDRKYASFEPPRFGGGVAAMLMTDPDYPAALGSRGPTEFDSVKPDVSACGVYVLAPKAANTHLGWEPPNPQYNQYVYLGGTSMAAPVVSGLAAIVRQYVRVARNVPTPSAALLKAILIAAAERTKPLTANQGDPYGPSVGYPDFHQGFGQVDLSRVLPHGAMPTGRILTFDDVTNGSSRVLQSHGSTDQRYYSVTVPSAGPEPLRIVLTWTDPPGKGLQSTLNLWVDGPNRSLFVGNRTLVYRRDPIFDAVNRRGIPFDMRNNVQYLNIEAPAPGEYFIRVMAYSTQGRGQGYALCVVGCLDGPLLRA